MSKLSEILQYFGENKQIICIILFCAYILGLFAFYSDEALLISSIFTLCVLTFCVFAFSNKKLNKNVSAPFMLFFYLIFVFGFLNASLHYKETDDFSNIQYLKNVELKGTVVSFPKVAQNGKNVTKFEIQPKEAYIFANKYNVKNSKVLVSLSDTKKETLDKIKYGNVIYLKGTLSTPAAAQNPSQFNYKKFLNNKGILKNFYVKENDIQYLSSPKIQNVFSSEDKAEFLRIFVMRTMSDVRDGVIEKHSKYVKSPKLEILGGVVFGDDAVNAPDDIKKDFMNSGLLHLLAASGLNVALILSLWFCVIHFLDILYGFKIISGMAVVFLYTLMTGFPPSIVRASVMLMLILAGKLVYREANGVSLIFTAGFLILIFKPEYLMDVGFQLSFLTTLGLIVCVPPVNHILKPLDKKYIETKMKKRPKYIKLFLLLFLPTTLVCCALIPFVAQLWAGPLQAFYFNSFSVYSIFANIAVVPFISIVSFLGFASTAICFVPYISDVLLVPLDFILNFTIGIVLNISKFFSNLPLSTVTVPSPTPLEIGAFYLFVVLFFVSLKYLFKRKILNLALIAAFVLFAAQFIHLPIKNTEVLFFSVGNADNCLIKTFDDKYIMIDTGRRIYKSSSSAKFITLQYFYDNNIKNLDAMVVSHYDSDHSGGVVDILNEASVKNFIAPALICESKTTCQIKDFVLKNKIHHVKPYTGQAFKYKDGVELINFVPNGGRGERNDTSTISLLKVGKYKFLFMADAGLDAFYSISDKLSYDIDVLKSAHHGASNTVDEYMLNKLSPEYAVLSTGRNPYGHPTEETVSLLQKHSKVLSTKDMGAIKFVVPKNPKKEMKVYRFDSKKKRFIRLNY